MLINLANRDEREIPGIFGVNKSQTDVSAQLIVRFLNVSLQAAALVVC